MSKTALEFFISESIVCHGGVGILSYSDRKSFTPALGATISI